MRTTAACITCVHAAESSLAASSRAEQVCAARRELFEPRVKIPARSRYLECTAITMAWWIALALAAVLWKECIIKRVIPSKERELVRTTAACITCVHAAESSLAASSRVEQVCAARRELFEPRVKIPARSRYLECTAITLLRTRRDHAVSSASRSRWIERNALSCCLRAFDRRLQGMGSAQKLRCEVTPTQKQADSSRRGIHLHTSP